MGNVQNQPSQIRDPHTDRGLGVKVIVNLTKIMLKIYKIK